MAAEKIKGMTPGDIMVKMASYIAHLESTQVDLTDKLELSVTRGDSLEATVREQESTIGHLKSIEACKDQVRKEIEHGPTTGRGG